MKLNNEMNLLNGYRKFLKAMLNYRGIGVLGGTVAILLLVLLSGSGLYLHSLESQSRLAEQEAVMLLKNAKQTAVVSKSLAERQESRIKTLESMRNRVPEHADVSKLLRDVSEVFEKNHLQLSDFRPGSKIERKQYSEFQMMVRAEGNYDDICRAVDGLLAMSWYSRITHLTLANQSDSQEMMSVDIGIAIATELKL